MSRRPSSRGGDRGSITPFVVIAAFAILLLAGLVIDGGAEMNGRGRAIAYAQEAARAGAQGIDPSDPVELSVDQAKKLAKSYCDQAKAKDPELKICDPDFEELADQTSRHEVVIVRTQVVVPTILLSMMGKSTLTASGSAVADPMPGIVGPDAGRVPTAPPPTEATPSGGAAPPSASGGGESTIGGCPTVTVTPKAPPSKGKGRGKGKGKGGGKGGKGPKPTAKPTTVVSCPTHPG